MELQEGQRDDCGTSEFTDAANIWVGVMEVTQLEGLVLRSIRAVTNMPP